MGTQYKSLLGLTEVIADSAEISNIDLEATNITGLTTSRIPEGSNLYYTETRVSRNPNVSSNTTHRERKDNPHGVTAAQVGIDNTDDIIEGVTNLYYTDIRFDDRLATKTTTSLAEGANLYYTTTRANADFDTRLATKTTTDLTEGTNLYYTTTRAKADFDTRLATKTTTDLTEGANLYYTDVRFDNRLATKTTTDLTEGANLYYTDVRFDNRLVTKTTTDLTEGANLYYTDARFDTRFATKTTANLTEGANLYYTTTRANADFDTRLATKTTTNLTEGTNLYYTDARFDARFGIKTTDDLTEGTNLYYTDVRFDNRLATKTTTDLTEGANLYYTDARFDTRLATKTTDDLTEGKNNIYYTDTRVSANADVKANTAYRNTGHLPLSGGTLTGDLTFELGSLEMPALTSNDGNTDFIVSASSEHYTGNYPAYIAFSDLTAEGWHIEGPYDYGGSNFLYNGNYGTIVNGSELKGQWIQVKTTSLYSVNSFVLSTSSGWVSRSPEDFTAVVSSDGINFTSIYSTTGLNWNGSLIKTFNNISQLNGYYFRLIVTRATAFNGLGIARWRITFNSYFHNINHVLNINGSDVNTIIEDVKANTDYRSVGHLPLDGGTLTGDLTVDGELNIGGEKITRGAANGLQLYGPSSDIGGPHIQAFVSTDDYPVFQQLNNSHGSIAMCFDAYADGFTWKSSSTSNAIIYKSNTDLEFSYSSGVAVGGEVTWNAGFSMDLANGLVSFSNGLDVTGDLTVSGTVDGVDLKALETDVKNNTDYTSIGHLPLDGGTLTGDLTFDNTSPFEMPVLTSNTGNPDFIASASSAHSSTYAAWKAFNKSTSTLVTECWHITPYDYTETDNDYGGDIETMVDGGLMGGQWLHLATTSRYYITGFYLQSRPEIAQCSENFTVAVSDDGKNFTSIYSRVNQTWGDNQIRTYPNDATEITPTEGRYFRLITTRSYNSDALAIKEWRITFSESTYLHSINQVLNLNGTHVDTLIADVKANTAKVSASGSINTHSDVNITTPTDGHILTYTSGEWKNIAPAAAAGYLPLSGGTMAGNLNMGNQDIDNVTQIFVDRNGAANNKIVLYDGGTPSTTAFYGFGIQSATLLYNVDTSAANHKFYYGGTNELFRIGNAAVYSYRDLDVKGNITVSGTVDGVDLKALNTTANNAIPLAAHNTYVPTIGDGTNNFTLTSATGHYTVIGNMCHVSFYVLWTSKGTASGTIRLSLPFTSATGPYSSMTLSAHNGIDSSLPSIGCFNLSATNYVVFFDKPTGLFSMNQTSFTNSGAIL